MEQNRFIFRNDVAIIILILILSPLIVHSMMHFKIFITQLIIWHMMYTQMLYLEREITKISCTECYTCSGHWVFEITIPALSCPLSLVLSCMIFDRPPRGVSRRSGSARIKAQWGWGYKGAVQCPP